METPLSLEQRDLRKPTLVGVFVLGLYVISSINETVPVMGYLKTSEEHICGLEYLTCVSQVRHGQLNK